MAISEAARLARFSTRGRPSGYLGGARARRGDRWFRRAIRISFVLGVILPSVVTVLYYAFFASDQYVSEMRFTLGAAEDPGSSSGSGGVPVDLIVQDTQVIANYLQSQAIVDALSKRTDLRAIYGGADADWFARLRSDASAEELERHWKRMTDATIKLPAGIVDFTVRAFKPAQAAALASDALQLSEQMVNELNQRMVGDSVVRATEDLQLAADRLATARTKLEQARNEEGMLDAKVDAETIDRLIDTVRSDRINLQSEYDSRAMLVSPNTPAMRAMKARIEAADMQIAELRAKVTLTPDSGKGRVISASMVKLEKLDLDREIAEQLYSTAAATLERVRILSESKLIYVNAFVLPTEAQEARYPWRVIDTLLIVLGTFAAWAALAGLATLARNNMA